MATETRRAATLESLAVRLPAFPSMQTGATGTGTQFRLALGAGVARQAGANGSAVSHLAGPSIVAPSLAQVVSDAAVWSGPAFQTVTEIAPDEVFTLAGMKAGVPLAFVHINLAGLPRPLRRAKALEANWKVSASSSVTAGLREAVGHLVLA